MISLKKLMAILLALCISGFAFGGGQQDSDVDDTSKFVEVTHHVMGNPPTNGMDKIAEEEWNKILKKEINTHMNLRWIEWADWYTKYNLILASGESVDLIHSSSTWLDMWPNAQKGAFLPLDDLLPQYAPKTWDEIPAGDWDQARYDGKIIAFPENAYTQYVNHGFMYRGDYAKEAGITDPIASYEDLAEYFMAVKQNHPDVVPYAASGSFKDWIMHGYFQSKSDRILVNLPTEYQIFMAKSFDDPYTLESVVYTDMFVDFAYLMKDWADKGFWSKDALNNTTDPREAMRAGKSASDQHHTQTYRYFRTEMDTKFPGSDLQFYSFSDTNDNLVAEPITHGATSVGRTSKNPERSVMVYEQLRQNKAFYQLVNYGVEGSQYEIADGVRVQPEGYNRELHLFESNFWGGRVDKFEIPSDQEFLGTKDLWAKFDKIVKSPFPYSKFILDKTPVEAEIAAVSDVLSQYLVPIMFGAVDNPSDAVEELRSALKKAGHDRLLDEFQTQVSEYGKNN